MTAPIRRYLWKLAIFINMDAVIEAQWSEQVIDVDRPDIQHMRRQVRQLTRSSKCIAIYLLTLASLYVALSFYTYYALSLKLFARDHFSQQYMQTLFEYACEIELMKLVHAVMLWVIVLAIWNMVRANLVLTKR